MSSERERKIKERERVYGRVIFDFVNAKTAEDVYVDLTIPIFCESARKPIQD
jgi:hypothetical protein